MLCGSFVCSYYRVHITISLRPPLLRWGVADLCATLYSLNYCVAILLVRDVTILRKEILVHGWPTQLHHWANIFVSTLKRAARKVAHRKRTIFYIIRL